MTRTPEHILKRLLTGRPKYKVAEVARFIAYFSSRDSQFEKQCKSILEMNQAPKRQPPTPPAGLKAKQAVPIVLAYVREEMGEPVALDKDERGSFSAMVEALDRRFGDGFTQKVIDKLNALPNGAHSLHYKR